MRHVSRYLFILTLGATLVLSGAVAGWSAEKFELKLACEYMDQTPHSP